MPQLANVIHRVLLATLPNQPLNVTHVRLDSQKERIQEVQICAAQRLVRLEGIPTQALGCVYNAMTLL
jgi:hypothetical protein